MDQSSGDSSLTAGSSNIVVRLTNRDFINVLRSFEKENRYIELDDNFRCCCSKPPKSSFTMCFHFGRRVERLDLLLSSLEHRDCDCALVCTPTLKGVDFHVSSGFLFSSQRINNLIAVLDGEMLACIEDVFKGPVEKELIPLFYRLAEADILMSELDRARPVEEDDWRYYMGVKICAKEIVEEGVPAGEFCKFEIWCEDTLVKQRPPQGDTLVNEELSSSLLAENEDQDAPLDLTLSDPRLKDVVDSVKTNREGSVKSKKSMRSTIERLRRSTTKGSVKSRLGSVRRLGRKDRNADTRIAYLQEKRD